jgi:outer membrane protein assembly factor BamB
MPRCCPLLLVMTALSLAPGKAAADDWPQWLGPQRDGVWRETGILDKFPPGGPKVLWRRPINPGYTGPAVADGRVYVMDRERTTDKDGKPLPPAKGVGIPGTERIVCLSATDGTVIWTHTYNCPYRIEYPTGPRTTPVVHAGRVYTLGAMGDIHCLDAATGKVIWAKNLLKEYNLDKPPVWGYAAHLLLDGERLITLAGGDGSAVVALHKDTGRELWRALSVAEIGYAPPILIEAGGTRQLIVFHSEAVAGLDPATGQVYWTERHPPHNKLVRPALPISTPKRMGDLLFVTQFHHGPLMLKLAADKPAVRVLWRGTSDNGGRPDGLHSLISTPVLQDGHIYGICGRGELRCLKAATGEQLWESLEPLGGKRALFATAFLVPNGDRCFIWNDQGDLIIATLTPQGYTEIDRAHLLDPVQTARGRDIVWSHPAFANRCLYARNDKEIICVSLAKPK